MTTAAPLAGAFSRKRSASWVVSGYPRSIAPDFPMNKYRTPWRANVSRISSAWAYSNRGAIAQPFRQLPGAPCPVLRHRVEGAVACVVEDRLVRVDEGVAHARAKRPARGRCKFGFPIASLVIVHRLGPHRSILGWNHRPRSNDHWDLAMPTRPRWPAGRERPADGRR